ncbi:MAG: alkaline phosphatase D family protein [Betaproteobacteria bacterium]
MNLRRRFLVRIGVFALSPFARRASAVPWLSFRPAAFDVTAESALIWVRTDHASTVRVQFAVGADWAGATLSPQAATSEAGDCTAAIVLNDLVPGTRYRYRITDGTGTPREALFPAGEFRTAPTSPRDFTFVFSGDTHARHRPFRLFDLMLEKKPEFFIHLGDTVYADSPRSQFRPALDFYRFKHREIRADPHLQQFLARVPTYAIWDDHEVENDFIGTNPSIPPGRQAFREYWPIRTEGGGDNTVLYRRFQWSPACEFFILDTRQYRDQGESGPGIGRTLLGARQLAWLKTALKASTATFKFIGSSVPFHQNGIDKWGGFKAERRELVAFILRERIRNIVILSADLHAAADLSDEKTGLTEFMVGPIAAPLQSVLAPDSRTRATARPGSYVGDDYNFGLIRVSSRDGKSVLRHEVIDSGGRVRYARELTATAQERAGVPAAP